MARPLVSVVVPVHDGERYLAGALTSVLAQRVPSVEVIVIDDGSADGSAEAAERFAPLVHVHRQAQAGAGAARNRGVELARGSYVAFLDADDVWTELSLPARLQALYAEPGLDMVFGRVRNFVSPDLEPERAARIVCPPDTQPGYSASAMLIRRETIERVGPFREDLRVGEFVDWMARARERQLRDAVLDETVLLRRLHGSNQGIRQRAARIDFARVARDALERRRAEAEVMVE